MLDLNNCGVLTVILVFVAMCNTGLLKSIRCNVCTRVGNEREATNLAKGLQICTSLFKTYCRFYDKLFLFFM